MEVIIEKLDNFGRGITHIHNKIAFVEEALPNEKVEVEIIKEHKKYLEAIVTNYIEISPIRITEECPYSSICGGCQLNHLCYNEENRFKRNKIKDILYKYAHIDKEKIEPIVYQERDHYRNKIILHGKDEKLGLYEKKSQKIIPIQECLLANHKINDMIKNIITKNQNIEEVTIKTSNDESKIMVSIKGKMIDTNELKKSCDVLFVNNEIKTKEKSIQTSIKDKQYKVSISSFFQINKSLTEQLYDEVLSAVKGKEINTALDLYCGTGTIGIYISDFCKKIIGIDNNPSNIKDANENKELNNVENIEFICDKVENQIQSFQEIDLIIVDPPRAGLDEKTREYLKKISPKQIIYVSCDPVTLGRDLNELQETYEITKIKPFNMFPRTYHVECISVLERKSVEK